MLNVFNECIITDWKVLDKPSTLWYPQPSNIIRVSSQECRWRGPRLLLTAARWHTGVWWWPSPGHGCAAPWRWCGCSHKWRRRCPTPTTQHPPRLSWWGLPLTAPPAAGCWPKTTPIGTAARRTKRVVSEIYAIIDDCADIYHDGQIWSVRVRRSCSAWSPKIIY